MSPIGRQWLFLLGGLGLTALFLWALVLAPPVGAPHGPYADLINGSVESLRHVTNAVGAVTFDYRGFDTLGEEFIFFGAVMAVRVLLRPTEDEEECAPVDHAESRHPVRTQDAVLAACGYALPVSFLVGIYVMAHGALTPGGGFQAGALLGSAFVLLYLGGRHDLFHRFGEPGMVDIGKAVGALGFAAVGLLGLAISGRFLTNVLPLGKVGQLDSGIHLLLINCCVGLEVASGVVVLFFEFLRQVLSIRAKPEAKKQEAQA